MTNYRCILRNTITSPPPSLQAFKTPALAPLYPPWRAGISSKGFPQGGLSLSGLGGGTNSREGNPPQKNKWKKGTPSKKILEYPVPQHRRWFGLPQKSLWPQVVKENHCQGIVSSREVGGLN